ncbi:MAG TPA: O-methyltransferase [Clostridiaceae bacterium]
MSGINFDYMENFIIDMIPENNGILKEIEDAGKKDSIPIIRKETANFLNLMVNIKKPKNVLELGTAIGYSSLMMAINNECIEKLITVEKDKDLISIAQNNINKYNCTDRIKIIEGDCLEVLSCLQENFDLIFIDAGKGHYNHYLPFCLKLLNKDGIIIADNVLFRGMVASKELVKRRKITIVKRMKEFLKLITEDPKLLTTVLPIGDGISVTTRRD